jgi:hypothetical protein
MANKYVNKSGNDANDGSTPELAKLTIQAAITAATVEGDLVIVGSGYYNEKLTTRTNVSCNLRADGVVILDGASLGNAPAITIAITSPVHFTMKAHTTGGKWVIRNHTATSLLYWNYSSFVGTKNVYLDNIDFLSNSNTNGVDISSTQAINTQVFNCIFSGFLGVGLGINSTNSSLAAYVNNNTFYNCVTGAYLQNATAPVITFIDNIISNCTTAYWFKTTTTNMTPVTNNHYYSITNWKIAATTYASLALLQGAGFDLTSIVANPNFVDVSENIFYLKSRSAINAAIGAIPFGYTRGQNYDPEVSWLITSSPDNTGWYNADGNIQKNLSTGFFELVTGLTGVIDSPVYDFEVIQLVKRIYLACNQAWPTNMIDTTNTDVRPNYQTIEIRGSNSAFDQDDAVIAWTEVKTEQQITPISGRYFQLRITMRSNGVAA